MTWAEVAPLAAGTVAVADATALERAIAAEDPQVGLPELVAWAEGDGGLMATPCTDHVRSGGWLMRLLPLTSHALRTAPDDPEHASVRAVLYLGERLRAEGVTLLEVTVGEQLLLDVVRWHQARGLPAGASLRRWRNDDEPPLRALAAQALCAEATIERMRLDPTYAGADAGAHIDIEAEHARQLTLALLERARAVGDDPARLEAVAADSTAAIAAAEPTAPAASFLLERIPERFLALVRDHHVNRAAVEALLAAPAGAGKR
jgi:hypothetical protein